MVLMTAQVTALSPNGNLWVEGEKVVSVNHEDQHLELAGWVRPEDIDAQNQVPSARIALGRAGTPAEASGGVLLFCLPEADYVTGQILEVDGGLAN